MWIDAVWNIWALGYPYLLFQTLHILFDAVVFWRNTAVVLQYMTTYWLLWYLVAMVLYHLLHSFLEGVDCRISLFAAGAEHIVGELMKRFKTPRPITNEFAEKLKMVDSIRGESLAQNLERGLMAIPLAAHEALYTAYINDVDGEGVFAQQLYGFGRQNDVFLGISTSGNSRNIMNTTVVARALGMKVIGLTGAKGGGLAKVSDVAIKVPEIETYMVQELHLPVYHCLCSMLEDRFFGG